MRVFVTGAGGHIGSAVVPELVAAGHEVIGLARSETSAAAVQALGAQARLGDLADLDGLRAAATEADAIIHLAFDHASMRAGEFAAAATADLATVRAFGDALAGTDKALIGIGLTNPDSEGARAAMAANPRWVVAREIASFAERGVRSILMAVPPVVHSDRDRSGFLPTLIGLARSTGVSGYLGEGANRWPAAHTLDVGRLYRLAVESAPAGAQLCAAAEEGITVREIAEVIGRHLDLPARAVEPEHFGQFAAFAAMDFPMSSRSTQTLLNWTPTHRGLIADLDAGHYFTS